MNIYWYFDPINRVVLWNITASDGSHFCFPQPASAYLNMSKSMAKVAELIEGVMFGTLNADAVIAEIEKMYSENRPKGDAGGEAKKEETPGS